MTFVIDFGHSLFVDLQHVVVIDEENSRFEHIPDRPSYGAYGIMKAMHGQNVYGMGVFLEGNIPRSAIEDLRRFANGYLGFICHASFFLSFKGGRHTQYLFAAHVRDNTTGSPGCQAPAYLQYCLTFFLPNLLQS